MYHVSGGLARDQAGLYCAEGWFCLASEKPENQ
nr:MAG TPA: hypothetical protein [Caudoviricetes sp.]